MAWERAMLNLTSLTLPALWRVRESIITTSTCTSSALNTSIPYLVVSRPLGSLL